MPPAHGRADEGDEQAAEAPGRDVPRGPGQGHELVEVPDPGEVATSRYDSDSSVNDPRLTPTVWARGV